MSRVSAGAAEGFDLAAVVVGVIPGSIIGRGRGEQRPYVNTRY